MQPDWRDLGPADLEDGDVALRKTKAGDRLVVLSSDGAVHVLDDRCPHEGYPLSQGDLRDGRLTCAWHNWKFDVSTGSCTTGGDEVRRYPCRVRDGRLEADLAVDLDAEREAARRGIATGLFEDDPTRAVRDALRLAKASEGSMDPAFTALAIDVARRRRWGFGHELAGLTDLITWVDEGDLDASEAFTAAAVVAGVRLAREPVRTPEPPRDPPDADTVTEMLETEDRGGAEAEVRRLTAAEGPDAAVQAMLPFVSRYILGYGHGTIYLSKVRAASRRLPQGAEELMAAAAVTLGWATRETALPAWAATRRAHEQIRPQWLADHDLVDRAAFEALVLEREGPAVQAVLHLLNEGIDPRQLLVAIAHAAAVRLSRFDPTWPGRPGSQVGVLDVSHAVTFAEACLDLTDVAEPMDQARMAVLAAGFVGKLAAGDAAEPPSPSFEAGSLSEAVAARDAAAAKAVARTLSPAERLAAYPSLRPFAAFDAFARPIFVVHAVKGLEALARLEARDPDPDAAYLEAFAQLAVHRWRERDPRGIAATARQFLADGRPPKGLY